MKSQRHNQHKDKVQKQQIIAVAAVTQSPCGRLFNQMIAIGKAKAAKTVGAKKAHTGDDTWGIGGTNGFKTASFFRHAAVARRRFLSVSRMTRKGGVKMDRHMHCALCVRWAPNRARSCVLRQRRLQMYRFGLRAMHSSMLWYRQTLEVQRAAREKQPQYRPNKRRCEATLNARDDVPLRLCNHQFQPVEATSKRAAHRTLH